MICTCLFFSLTLITALCALEDCFCRHKKWSSMNLLTYYNRLIILRCCTALYYTTPKYVALYCTGAHHQWSIIRTTTRTLTLLILRPPTLKVILSINSKPKQSNSSTLLLLTQLNSTQQTSTILNLILSYPIPTYRTWSSLLGDHVCWRCELRCTRKNVRHIGSKMGRVCRNPSGFIWPSSGQRIFVVGVGYGVGLNLVIKVERSGGEMWVVVCSAFLYSVAPQGNTSQQTTAQKSTGDDRTRSSVHWSTLQYNTCRTGQ